MSLYTSDVAKLVKALDLGAHLYADDTQLYGHCSPSNSFELASRVIRAIDSIHEWMSSNRLSLNTGKTQFIWLGTKHSLAKRDTDWLTSLLPSLTELTSMRNLGFIIDQELNMKDHITKLCQSCYYQLHQIRTVRHSLTSSAIQTLVHAFICTRVDFSNSLLYGTSAYLLDRLQSVLNSAARLILRIGKYDPSDLGCNSTWPSLAPNSVSNSIQAQLHHEQLPGWPCTGVLDRALPFHEWHSSKAQPSVIVPGSAPGSSISEGTIRSKRFLRLLTTAVEFTSCRHLTSSQWTWNFSGRDLKLTICNSPCYATEDLCHQCDLYYYYYYY